MPQDTRPVVGRRRAQGTSTLARAPSRARAWARRLAPALLALLACCAPVDDRPDASAEPSGTVAQAVIPAANYAQGRPATQSSTAYGAGASRAVDGNVVGNFAVGSVTHTQYEESPYWEVDLGNSYEGSEPWHTYFLQTVELYGRTDCCADRLRDVFVFVSSYPIRGRLPSDVIREAGVSTYIIGGQAATPVHRVNVGRGGRYVRVQLAGAGYLSLAEVRVLGGTCPTPTGPLRYDQVQQRSMHNAQTFAEAEVDQLLYHRARNLEWDLRATPPETPLSGASSTNNWYVWHRVDENWRCRTLDDCLQLLNAFRRAVPQHEVITLHLEFKTDCASPPATFADGVDPEDATRRTPAGLDQRLRDRLGSALFTPRDLMASCPGATDLHDALVRCGWPTLDALRGRVVVLGFGFNNAPCMGAGGDNMNWRYAPDSATGHRRLAFLAPLGLTGDDGVIASRNWVVAHTEVGDQRAIELRQSPWFSHHLLRSGQADDPVTFARRQAACHNFINTDRMSVDHAPWARTDNAGLYPFCPIGESSATCRSGTHAASASREVQRLYELRVDSGDIDGTSDSFAFAHEHRPNGATTTLTAFVGTASNNGVHRWAKGCLMVRQSLDPSAGYYAVCRTGDDHELHVQYRAPCAGCGTDHRDAALGGSAWDGEDAAWVRLVLTRQSDGRLTAQGYGSVDGAAWQAIGPARDFFVDLPYQGLAASSAVRGHRLPDGSLTRFYFTDVRRDGVSVPATTLRATGIGAPAAVEFVDRSGASDRAPAFTHVLPALQTAPGGRLVALGADGRPWQLARPSGGNWPATWQVAGTAVGLQQIAVGTNADGRLEIFALDGNPGLWHAAQTSVGGEFGAWSPIWGVDLTRIAVARNLDGRLEVLGLARVDGSLVRIAQTAPNGPWGSSFRVGGAAGFIELGVGRNADGRLQVFAVDANPGIWSTAQSSANGPWSGSWTPTWGLHVRRVHVASDMDLAPGASSDGRIHVFGLTHGHGALGYLRQTWTNGSTFSWTTVGTAVGLIDMAVGRHANGLIQVFALDGSPGVWDVLQTSVSGGWTDWLPTWGPSLGRISVGANSDGRLELFGLGTTPGELLRSAQTAPNGWFTAWAPLSGAP